MRNPCLVLAAAAVAGLWSGSSIAEPRSGPSLHVLGGVGYTTGSYVFEGNSLPGYGMPVRPLRYATTLAASTLSASLQPGWFLTQHFKIAVELGVNAQTAGSKHFIANSQISGAVGWQALAVIDYHFSEGPGFHVQGGGGIARTFFLNSTEDIADAYNIGEPEFVTGAIGFVGAGYDFGDRFGLVMRGSTARLSNDNSRFRPVAVSLMADFALF